MEDHHAISVSGGGPEKPTIEANAIEGSDGIGSP
jgi:hypothetical protein